MKCLSTKFIRDTMFWTLIKHQIHNNIYSKATAYDNQSKKKTHGTITKPITDKTFLK